MMCVVGMREYSSQDIIYMLLETNTESFFCVGRNMLHELIIRHRMHIRHTSLIGNEASNEHWYNQLCCQKKTSVWGLSTYYYAN